MSEPKPVQIPDDDTLDEAFKLYPYREYRHLSEPIGVVLKGDWSHATAIACLTDCFGDLEPDEKVFVATGLFRWVPAVDDEGCNIMKLWPASETGKGVMTATVATLRHPIW